MASGISRRLLLQNARLRESIAAEFESLPAAKLFPTFHSTMSTFERDLMRATYANDNAIREIFGEPSRAGIVEGFSEWIGLHEDDDVYSGLGSLWRHCIKDWSVNGAELNEPLRAHILSLIQHEHQQLLSHTTTSWSRSPMRILVPGCGQARLAWSLADALPDAQVVGLERSEATWGFARHLLQCKEPNSLTIFPWLDSFPNNGHPSARCSSMTVPDIAPGSPPNLSIQLADFPKAAHHLPGQHAICTHFFLDCLEDLVDGCTAIWDKLLPGGAWIFSGPLHCVCPVASVQACS